eukprot:2651349-Pyramimonas_sp.AAC.1
MGTREALASFKHECARRGGESHILNRNLPESVKLLEMCVNERARRGGENHISKTTRPQSVKLLS